MNLTNGALVQILNGKTPENPTFQLINAKKIGSTASASVDRYRLILSDGDHMYSHIMLAAQLNPMIADGSLDNMAVIEVTNYMCNVLNGDKKVIILLDLKVLEKGKNIFELLDSEFQIHSIPWENCLAVGSDNAPNMVGCNSGVIVFAAQKHEAIFKAGCVLHLVHIAARKGAAHLAPIEETLVDSFYYFKKSALRQQDLKQFQDLYNVEHKKCLKHVNTRWLSIKRCVERLLHNWRPLKSYFQAESTNNTSKLGKKKAESLFDVFRSPTNELFAHFLVFAMKLFDPVLVRLQAEEPLIHQLRPAMEQPLKEILSKFIKSEALVCVDILQVDFVDETQHKADIDLGIGVAAMDFIENAESNHLRSQRLPDFYTGVRQFYLEVARYLKKSLPWEDRFPKAVSVVDVEKRASAAQTDLLYLLRWFPCLVEGSSVGNKIGNPNQLNPAQIPAAPSAGDPAVKEEPVQGKENNAVTAARSPVNNNTLKTNKTLTPGTPGSNRVFQIASLTPYQNRWRIRARVTNKSNIRTWNNSRGEGRLFNINLLDESGEIRCTGFNEQVDKFYNMLEVNKVYYFSKCTLKTANKQYNTLNCDYEMTMNSETVIESCNDQVDLPTMTFNFAQISSLEKHKPNSNVDVIGICKVCKDVGTVISRASQKEITKRDLQIVDQSGVAVNLTLWGDDAIKFDGDGCPIIAVKGARVSDFGGRSLSVGGGSVMMVNPDLKEAHILRGWYEREGRDMNFNTFQGEGGSSGTQSTNWKTFAQAKMENLGQGDKADYFTAKGTVIFLKRDNCMYQACPSAECNKKVVDLGNGMYRCEKCNQEFPNYKWRMILSANVADYSDNQWITCFQESAETMLNTKANDLGALRQEDEIGFDNVMQEALFKPYVFRMRAKMETYNDENRLKTVCMSASPVNWPEYGQHLLDQLEQMGV